MDRLMQLATDACRDGGCTCSFPVTVSTVEIPGIGETHSVRIEHESTCPLKLLAMAAWN